jgi:site-specific DNA recombinase
MKRAIIYLRISTDRQSNYSIEGQQMHIRSWCERNNVEIIDVFTDEGFSARNFDRPDYKRLDIFIKQHYRTVDYLVVNSFDRFSRDAGEAIR